MSTRMPPGSCSRPARPIVMLGLDVTHKALVTAERLARIQAIGTPVALACAGLLDFYNRYDKERYHIPGAPLHDPCVIAYLLQPGLFCGQRRRVEIETEGTHTTGRTVVDWWQRSPREPNALVINDRRCRRLLRPAGRAPGPTLNTIQVGGVQPRPDITREAKNEGRTAQAARFDRPAAAGLIATRWRLGRSRRRPQPRPHRRPNRTCSKPRHPPAAHGPHRAAKVDEHDSMRARAGRARRPAADGLHAKELGARREHRKDRRARAELAPSSRTRDQGRSISARLPSSRDRGSKYGRAPEFVWMRTPSCAQGAGTQRSGDGRQNSSPLATIWARPRPLRPERTRCSRR